MKHCILTALATIAMWFLSIPAVAQYVPEWNQGDLKRKGTKIAVQGEKLDKEATLALLNQVGGPEMVASWEKYTSQRGWGIGLTAGGYTLAVAGLAYGGVYFLAGIVGTIFAAIGGQEAVDNLWSELGPRVSIGGGALIGGLVVGTAGAITLGVANGKMKKIVQTCDAAGATAPVAYLTFGPAPSGTGLVLHF